MVMELLKKESCHDANFVITGGNGGCRYDSLYMVPPVTT